MKQRILIVDDDKLLNKINEKILHKEGIVSELHIVPNGREALEYLENRIDKQYTLPDLIILDLNMPVMDGFEFMDEFNRLDFPGKRNIEIIVFSDSKDWKDRQRAIAKGIKNYIDKPYLLRGLHDIIRRRRAGKISSA